MVVAPKRNSSTIMILVIGMLVTGCFSSIFSKWQDMQCVENCDSPDQSKHHPFEQPLFQTGTMFLGECLCLIAFTFLSSRLNPFRTTTRASASAQARRAALSGHVKRLAAQPLSRPDESAIFFNESAISLQDESRYDEEEVTGGKQEEKGEVMGWQKALLFWLPTLCDIMGTTAMNVGLLFVPVSVYQMLRGAIVLFVAILSIFFLGKKLNRAQWVALGTVMSGVAVVGMSSLGKGKKESSPEAEAEADPLVGIVLILLAQVFAASQFVIEEKIMERYSVDPLLAVGYEGLFGISTTIIAFPILYHFIGSTPAGKGGYFDVPNGWNQIVSNPTVWGSSIAIAVSIAFFNFCGLAVTKSLSATSRSTIDTCRTLGIWLVSMYLGWEHFQWLQVLGFSLLVYGTFVFNGITRFPAWTNFHHIESLPIIILPDEEDDTEEESDYETASTRSRGLEDTGRPLNRRSGSGRRGEASPLLKGIDA